MKTSFTVVFLLFFYSTMAQAQGWQQTAGTPQGGGVTDMLVRQSNGWIFVTTSSYNWPAEPGGVRVSTDNGTSWINQTNSYVARTITEGPDGYLYSSIWPDPNFFAADGLYRSINNGLVWSPLGFVEAGDNIFSIAVSPSTPVVTIFAGTRNGVIRSTDDGSTFQNTSIGIPANSWVRDLKVASNGNVIAATTNGVFFSTNNGDNWLMAGGIQAGDTVNTLIVVPDTALTDRNNSGGFDYVIAGTIAGEIVRGILDQGTLTFDIVLAITGDPEVAAFVGFYDVFEQVEKLYAALYDVFGQSGGVAFFDVLSGIIEYEGDNLPNIVSAIGLFLLFADSPHETTITLYAGVFENQVGGAKIYTLTQVTDVKEISSEAPRNFNLYQNYPNPFNPSTAIGYQLPVRGNVTLKVYDVLGNEVATLIDEEKPAGTYEVEFNVAAHHRFALTSGIYFYQLRAGNFIKTNKMILIK